MNVHNKKTKTLNNKQRNDILGKYLTHCNKQGLSYFKGEIEGVIQEKEDAQLILKEQKRQMLQDSEDLIYLELYSKEYRMKISMLEQDT